MQTEKVVNHIVNWLKNYATNAGVNGFVIGISGGIDSAVTSTLCAKTGLQLLCVEMPIKAQRLKMAYTDIPSNERKRIAGKKKVNEFRDGFKILTYMVKSFLKLTN